MSGCGISQSSKSVNIYNANGSLTSNRTVTQAGFSLSFTGGNIGIGVAAVASQRLTVKGSGNSTATIGFEVNNSPGTSWFRVYDDGTFWSQGLTDVAHLITTFGNSMEVRYNGVTTSTFTMQVGGTTKSSFITQNGLSRFNQATNQSWGVYGSDNNPYILFTESTKLVSVYKSFSMQNNTPVTGLGDSFEMYATDIVAGNSAPHFRTENGDVIKLFKSSAYTVTNVTTDRSYNANAVGLNEIADVLGTLISDLQATGIIG